MTEEYAPKHVCLFSGGHDSLVSTHYCMESGETEKVLHIDTGIRQDESDRRMRTTSDQKVEEAKQYVWHSPILHWSEEDCREYMEEHDLPRSPVKQTYHHSGECLCGAFGNRQVELLILEAHYPETAERIKDLEDEVRERHGAQNDRSYWGHQDMDEPDLRGLKAEQDEQQATLDLKLCMESVDQKAVLSCLIANYDEATERFDWLQAKRDVDDLLEMDRTLTLFTLKKHTKRHAAVRNAVTEMERDKIQSQETDHE
jgi:hypothetical protein